MINKEIEGASSKRDQGVNIGDHIGDQNGNNGDQNENIADQNEDHEERGSLQQIVQNMEKMLIKLTRTKTE